METEAASNIQLIGAAAFGIVIGWLVYYINRYRKEDVQFSDLATIIGILGGGAILALFPAATDLFGAYGVGLFIGFFTYFLVLIILVNRSDAFTSDWFLDGRRKKPDVGWYIPRSTGRTVTAMALTETAADAEENDSPIS